MNLQDYVVKKAIKNVYNKKVLNKEQDVFYDLYNKLSDKLGYKLSVKKTITLNDTLNIPSSLDMYIKRCETTLFNTKMRFLEWDKETKSSYYYTSKGEIFRTDYKNGLSNDIPTYIIDRYKKLINFVKNNNIDYMYDIEYMMIGYDDNHNFFLGSDNKHYYTNKNDYKTFNECNESLNDKFNNFIDEING